MKRNLAKKEKTKENFIKVYIIDGKEVFEKDE